MNSKLLLPRSSDTIGRKRLYPLFVEIPKKKLTTVIAGAGYGKTTLVAQFCEYIGLDTVWYRLDKSDKDFITFLSYLIAGTKRYFPEFGVETLHRIEEAQNLSREREAILAIFLSEIEELAKRDLIVVLDDYYQIQDSLEINESVKFLLENLSPLIHLIIISRINPSLSLSRLGAQREILDINEKDLMFTIPEIEELYSDLFHISLQDESLQILHQKTDGWITGLILFYHSMRGKSRDEIVKLLVSLRGSHRIISNYLEENVYDLLPNEIRDFLIKTSILSCLNVDFCDQLLKTSHSREILIDLEERHLFTFPFDEEREWYHYHHLFQGFLQTKLHQELGLKAVTSLHEDAAILWEKRGEKEDALGHYLKAEQFDKACRLLNQLGRVLLKEGRLQLLDSYLREIPESYLDKEPWLQFTQAQFLEFSGRPQEAIQAYRKAHETFRKHNSSKGVDLCLNALGYNHYLTGDFIKAEKRLKELLNQVEGNPHLCINILGHLIFITSHLGKMSVADRYFNLGMTLLDESKDKGLLAWLHLFQGFRYGSSGDFARALKLGVETEEICRELGRNQLLSLDYHLISWSCYYLGLFSKGMEMATKGLNLVRERGFRDISHGWLLIDACLNATALGKIPEAIKDGKESLKICRDLGNRWTQAWAFHALQGAYEKSGDMLSAENCAQSAIDVTEGLTLPLDRGFFKGSLAESLISQGRLEAARPLLENAEKNLEQSKLYLSRVYLWYARFYWEKKQKEAAIKKAVSGLQLCEENQHDIWVVSEKHWIIPLLVEIFARDKMQDYLQSIFKKIGPYAYQELASLQKKKNLQIKNTASNIIDELKKAPPHALKVCCLGEFRVFRGDDQISEERWKSKKAKMLFKFLLYRRNRGYLTREILMELLWPGEDPQKTANRLRVALTTLRKILEPELLKGTASSYLLRDGDSYKLSLGDGGMVDCEEFRGELKLADAEKNPEKSISHYLNAEALYQGDFLEEDLYMEWCREERERLKEEYMYVLEKIMEHFEKKDDYPKCIEYAKKYLKMDKYAEITYQRLMKYYSLTGNRAMVARTFERCKENIVKELDCPLSKETEVLYQELVLT